MEEPRTIWAVYPYSVEIVVDLPRLMAQKARRAHDRRPYLLCGRHYWRFFAKKKYYAWSAKKKELYGSMCILIERAGACEDAVRIKLERRDSWRETSVIFSFRKEEHADEFRTAIPSLELNNVLGVN